MIETNLAPAAPWFLGTLLPQLRLQDASELKGLEAQPHVYTSEDV